GAGLVGKAGVSHRLTIALAKAGTMPEGLGAQQITGHVLETSGKPVPGALVLADPNGPSTIAVDGQARAGADGSFVLDGLDRRSYTIRATAPGFAPGLANAAAPGGLTLRLQSGS